MFLLLIPKTSFSAQYNINFHKTELPLVLVTFLMPKLFISHTHTHKEVIYQLKSVFHCTFQVHAWLWVQYLISSNTAKDDWLLETRNPHTGRVSFSFHYLLCVCFKLNIPGFRWSCRCLTQYPFIRNTLYLSHLEDGLISSFFQPHVSD